MSDRPSMLRHRRWADGVIILASVYAISTAAWFPPELMAGGDNEAVAAPTLLWSSYALAGLIGIAAVFVALKSRVFGVVMTIGAALLMLSSFLAMERITLVAALSVGITAAALLLAAPFMGPMPTPRDELRARESAGQG